MRTGALSSAGSGRASSHGPFICSLNRIIRTSHAAGPHSSQLERLNVKHLRGTSTVLYSTVPPNK
jgi:hypothetical protein